LMRIMNRPDEAPEDEDGDGPDREPDARAASLRSARSRSRFPQAPEDLAGWLDAMNGFLNLEMRRTERRACPDAEPHVDALIGAVAAPAAASRGGLRRIP